MKGSWWFFARENKRHHFTSMKICQANRLHVTKSAVQAWAESLTYAWHMAVLDHRFPPEAMSVDHKRFDQEPELASQRIRQLGLLQRGTSPTVKSFGKKNLDKRFSRTAADTCRCGRTNSQFNSATSEAISAASQQDSQNALRQGSGSPGPAKGTGGSRDVRLGRIGPPGAGTHSRPSGAQSPESQKTKEKEEQEGQEEREGKEARNNAKIPSTNRPSGQVLSVHISTLPSLTKKIIKHINMNLLINTRIL